MKTDIECQYLVQILLIAATVTGDALLRSESGIGPGNRSAFLRFDLPARRYMSTEAGRMLD